MHSHCKEYLAEMWMAITEERRVVNTETAWEVLAETFKISGMGTKRAASSAQQINGADQGVRRPG